MQTPTFPLCSLAILLVGSVAASIACGPKVAPTPPHADTPDAGPSAKVPYVPVPVVSARMPDKPFFGSRKAAVDLAKTAARSILKKTGTQNPGDAAASFELNAQANHCYRATVRLSEGAAGILSVVDEAGRVAHEARPKNAAASDLILPEAGALCFSSADRSKVIVSLGLGKGDFALEVFED